jgi:hypothetical protein
MPFRLEHITAADRVAIAATCLACAGQYGLISEVARAAGTSRQFVYDLRARAQVAVAAALAPSRPGRRRPAHWSSTGWPSSGRSWCCTRRRRRRSGASRPAWPSSCRCPAASGPSRRW